MQQKRCAGGDVGARRSPALARIDRWLPIALMLGALAYLTPLLRRGLIIADEGWVLDAALRMRAGDVLYRDIWVFYPPIRFHVAQWLIELFGESYVPNRIFWMLLLCASVGMLYRIARRFAPPSFAWIPSVTYALVPGPWHKATYGFCTTAFLLLLARYLECPRSTARRIALGATCGLAVLTRQDVGSASLVLAVGAAAIRPWWSEERSGWREGARDALTVAGSAAAAVLPILVWYATNEALDDLLEAVFLRGFGQIRANTSGAISLDVASTVEGPLAGILLLLPAPIYAATALVLLRDIARERRPSRTTMLIGAALAIAVPTLAQAWLPALIVRFLQSATPCYLMVTFLIARAGAACGATVSRVLQVAAAASIGTYVHLIVAGLPLILPDAAFSGSMRLLRYKERVLWLGEETTARWRLAEEIRLVRHFFDENAADDEYVFAAPLQPGWYVLLGRRNATRYTAEHLRAGDYNQSEAMKREDMERLLASPTRYAIVERRWWAEPEPVDAIHSTLVQRFVPVREYDRQMILERGNDPVLAALHRRSARGVHPREDLAELERRSARMPDDPLLPRLLARAWLDAGETGKAIEALRTAARLDPIDPSPRELAAELLLALGRRDEALRELDLAREVRPSTDQKRLRRRAREQRRAGR